MFLVIFHPFQLQNTSPDRSNIVSKEPLYGPHNPHPLSQLNSELVWEGKYDEYGNRNQEQTV